MYLQVCTGGTYRKICTLASSRRRCRRSFESNVFTSRQYRCPRRSCPPPGDGKPNDSHFQPEPAEGHIESSSRHFVLVGLSSVLAFSKLWLLGQSGNGLLTRDALSPGSFSRPSSPNIRKVWNYLGSQEE